jgi:hypothetical protein
LTGEDRGGSGYLTGEIFGRGLGMTPGPHLSVTEREEKDTGSGGGIIGPWASSGSRPNGFRATSFKFFPLFFFSFSAFLINS